MQNEQDAQKLLATPEGKRLLERFQESGSVVQQAGQALKAGNTDQVKALIAPLLRDPEVAALLKKLGGTKNG